jgi:hypothetical protein
MVDQEEEEVMEGFLRVRNDGISASLGYAAQVAIGPRVGAGRVGKVKRTGPARVDGDGVFGLEASPLDDVDLTVGVLGKVISPAFFVSCQVFCSS